MHSTRPGSLEQHLPLPPPTEDEHGAPEVWKCRLPSSGEVVAIGRTEVDARRLCTDMLVFTLAEVAVAIEALGEIALEAKRTFAGATVRAVRSRSSEKLKEGHKERAATPKRKPLPPAGSYQSLTKKMPPGTVYKGESYPVSNIKAIRGAYGPTTRGRRCAVERRAGMKDSTCEAVIEGATEVESLVEESDADGRCRMRDALDRIIARFDCCPADDLPARAVTALVNAWLSTLDMEEQDEFWAAVDENQQAASSSIGELTNA